MSRKPLPIHGRGASHDPPNRFETLHVQRDGWTDDDDPLPRTRFLRDHTRDVIATNDSPDVPLDAGINPYRGCEHGCVYCLSPLTPVLHSDGVWRPIGDIRVGDELVGFEERPRPGRARTLRKAVVEAVWWSRKPTRRLVTERTDVVTTAEHLWLEATDRWSRTDRLTPGRFLRHLPVEHPEAGDRTYAPCPVAASERTHALATRQGSSRGWRRVVSGSDSRPALGPVAEAASAALPPTTPERVEAVEPGPVMDVVDIRTSSATFFAAGLATHNCYARPTHEYLGFSPGLDFETRILVKEDAPALLRKRLSSPRWRPRPLMLSGNTDPYQPAERRLRITRGVLEVLTEFRHPVAIITKNHLVTRDIDLLAELASHGAAGVTLSMTTLRNELQRVMEPRTSTPARRLDAIHRLADAGVPVGVNVAPVIPGLTDQELPAILDAAAGAGATTAGYILLRLPHGVKELFETWLEQHFPDRRDKVLNRLRSLHDGSLYDSTWSRRKRGEGPYAEQIRRMFEVARRKAGLDGEGGPLSSASFRRSAGAGQTDLFG